VVKKILQQVKAAGDGEEDHLLNDPGAALIARVLAFGFHFFDCDYGVQIFEEVHAAFFAGATLELLVMACRALEAQSRVASWAEARGVECVGGAFWAFHVSIL